TMRYSGSPLPMGFGEATQQKSVVIVDFQVPSGAQAASGTHPLPECAPSAHRYPAISLIDVPVFQKLERIQGDWHDISSRILELSAADSRAWLEIIYQGLEVMGDLRVRLDAAIDGTGMEILRVKNNRIIERVLGQMHDQQTLDDLSTNEVFERCLAVHQVPPAQRPALLHAYQEILASL